METLLYWAVGICTASAAATVVAAYLVWKTENNKTMTHSLYLSIIGAVVFIAAYIILRLLRDNDRLMLELDEAKAEARTLDAEQRQTIQQLYGRIGAMQRRINKLKSLP